VTQPNVPDPSAAFAEIASGLAAGMPAFRKIKIDFESAADLRQWAAQFGIKVPATEGQPYPSLTDLDKSDQWLIHTDQTWHGLRVELVSTDPITDDQRKHWVESGWLARMIKHQAKRSATASTGLDYSRADCEPDDPTPVSPARAPLHVGVMDDGGLVDVTPAITAHYETGFWKGPNPGDCGTECVCGRTFDGLDTVAEATELLKRHINAERQPVHFLLTSGVTACDVKLSQVGTWRTTSRRGETTCDDCHDGMPF